MVHVTREYPHKLLEIATVKQSLLLITTKNLANAINNILMDHESVNVQRYSSCPFGKCHNKLQTFYTDPPLVI